MRETKYHCVDDTTQNLVDSFTPFAAELVIQNILRRGGNHYISHTADDLIFIHDNEREFYCHFFSNHLHMQLQHGISVYPVDIYCMWKRFTVYVMVISIFS